MDKIRNAIDWSLLTIPEFLLFNLSSLLRGMGYYIPNLFLIKKMKMEGASNAKAQLSVVVMGATNLIGRLIVGGISDQRKMNRMALVTAAGVACAFCNLGLVFAESTSANFGLAGTYAFFLATGNVLNSSLLVDLL